MVSARPVGVCTVLVLILSSACAAGGDGSGTVLTGAGDIGLCGKSGAAGTAALLDGIPGGVFTLGDNVYPSGTLEEFTRCYGPTWGRQRHRTRPTVGNHEYATPGAAGYFDYFGAAAGTPGEGWYSYESGSWHVVVLNSNCANVPGGCQAGSTQERWLRADLATAAQRTRCTVAMWHHPLFTSGKVPGPTPAVLPLFQALYDAGVEIVLSGHNHQYERFAPQTPQGARDDQRGVRQFVVGTGGAGPYPFGSPAPNSQARIANTTGVLSLSLTDGAYNWKFLPSGRPGVTGDVGHGTCH